MRTKLFATTALCGLIFTASPSFASCVTSDGGTTYACTGTSTALSTTGNYYVTSGTLSVGNAFQSNTNISSGATLSFYNVTSTYTGAISGAGNVTVDYLSNVTLGGSNTTWNGNLVMSNNSVVKISSADNLGTSVLSGDVSLTLNANNLTLNNNFNGTNLTINTQNFNAVYAGNMTTPTDDIQFAKFGTGRLEYTGTQNYTYIQHSLQQPPFNPSSVFVGEGTLAVRGDNQLADGVLIYLDGQLEITGGNFTNITQGYSVDNGASSNDGGVLIDGHAVRIGNRQDNFGGPITVRNHGEFTIGGVLNTPEKLDIDGTSTVKFGTLLGGFSRNANLATGATVFTASGAVNRLFGVISGGNWIKDGAGILDLQNANTSTGVTINGGILSGSQSVSLPNTIITTAANTGVRLNETTFVNVAGSGTGTYNGVISGPGFVDMTGAGSTTLTANQTYTGATTITNGGRLAVNGTLASSGVTVSNGTLGGTGTVTNTEIQSGAILAPGNSIGTLHVNGTLDFADDAHYIVEYDNTHADNTIATGAVTIGNGVTLDIDGANGTYAPNTVYTILQGASITGMFDEGSSNLAFLDADLIYNADSVQLTLARNDIDFASVAQNQTQTSTANAISALGTGNPIFDAFTTVSTSQAATTLQSLSGAGVVGTIASASPAFIQPVMAHIGMSGTSINNTNVAANTDPSLYQSAYMAPNGAINPDSTPWFQAIGGLGHTLSSASSPGQRRNNYGAVAGIDHDLDSGMRLGVFGGYQRSEFSSDRVGSSSDVNSYQLGTYVRKPVPYGFILTGGAAAMYHDIDSVRHITVGASAFSPYGSTKGNTLTAFGELAHPLIQNLDWFGNLSVTRNHTDGYTETNGGAANLIIGDSTKTNPATTLGVRGSSTVGTATIDASLGWQHLFGSVESSTDMRFTGGATTFTSTGTPIARNAGIVGVNVSGNLWSGAQAYAGYDGTLARDAQDHSFKLGIKAAF